MMNIILANAFSLQMIDEIGTWTVCNFYTMPVDEVKKLIDKNNGQFTSCIGHSDTANVVSALLEREVPCNRVPVKIDEGDILIVAQVTGGRLPEGCTKLPEGVELKFIRVRLASSAEYNALWQL